MKRPSSFEALTLGALQQEWNRLNWTSFREAMRRPTLALHEAPDPLARWDRRTRCISFSRPFLIKEPWGAVIEVLKHEMAHQYVHEILRVIDETAHGPAFQQVCTRLGVDATAAGVPTGAEDRIMRRVQKLLALAQSPEPAEAEAAMAAAQRMMLEHNLGATASTYTWRHLGAPTGRQPRHTQIIGGILCAHFFVEAIWVKVFDVHRLQEGTVLEVCGSPENVEMAAYVWDFLHATGERLWVLHKRRNGIVADRDRRRFLTGVMNGFAQRQREQKRANAERGLIWVGDPRLKAFYGARHPKIRAKGGASLEANAAFLAGMAEGRTIVLHKPVEGTASTRGRLIEG